MRLTKFAESGLQYSTVPCPVTGKPNTRVPICINDNQAPSRLEHACRFCKRQVNFSNINTALPVISAGDNQMTDRGKRHCPAPRGHCIAVQRSGPQLASALLGPYGEPKKGPRVLHGRFLFRAPWGAKRAFLGYN